MVKWERICSVVPSESPEDGGGEAKALLRFRAGAMRASRLGGDIAYVVFAILAGGLWSEMLVGCCYAFEQEDMGFGFRARAALKRIDPARCRIPFVHSPH